MAGRMLDSTHPGETRSEARTPNMPDSGKTRGNSTLRSAKRIIIAVVGGTLSALGVALLVLPGPGILVVGAGVSILATEFVWARHFLHKARDAVSQVKAKANEWKNGAT